MFKVHVTLIQNVPVLDVSFRIYVCSYIIPSNTNQFKKSGTYMQVYFRQLQTAISLNDKAVNYIQCALFSKTESISE